LRYHGYQGILAVHGMLLYVVLQAGYRPHASRLLVTGHQMMLAVWGMLAAV
jgi:hypothetical protein